MNQDTIEMLRQAALLHDVGKLGFRKASSISRAG